MADIRPIDANALLELIEVKGKEYGVTVANRCTFRDILKLARTLDYAPAKHGEWVGLEFDGYADGCPVYDLWECSECKGEHKGEYDTLTDYCPNCGAKMDGGKENV